MISYFVGICLFLSSFLRSRSNLGFEILALRQQLNRKHPRPRLRTKDKLFWVFLHRFLSGWRNALIVIKPETVVAWHRAGFRLFWRFRSRTKKPGRSQITAEIRSAVRKMKEENAWGAPRIHGELLKLGCNVSERSVSRYLLRIHPSDQARKLWATFLHSHREIIAAMDFFAVSTLTFRILYCFFVIEPWATQNPSFQCHRTSNQFLDSATIESFSTM
jgi:putative transposase